MIQYNYDYNNHRVTRIGVDTRDYLYYGNQVLEEIKNDTRLALYGYDGQGLISRTDAGGRSFFYLWDGLGSCIGIIDQNGRILQNYEYSAFGENLSGKDLVNEFRYVGRFGGQQDDDTGLTYFWNRWYDPRTGRWISEDPIGLNGGINLYGYAESVGKPSLNAYAYCDNNPINFVDPFGLFSVYDQPFTNEVAQIYGDTLFPPLPVAPGPELAGISDFFGDNFISNGIRGQLLNQFEPSGTGFPGRYRVGGFGPGTSLLLAHVKAFTLGPLEALLKRLGLLRDVQKGGCK